MAELLRTPHYETGVYVRNATFLEDEEYGRALDTFVKACVDLLLTDADTGEVSDRFGCLALYVGCAHFACNACTLCV